MNNREFRPASNRDAKKEKFIKAQIILSILICLFVLNCAPKYGNNWQRISEGGFSVMMPAQPTKTRKGEGSTTFRLEHNGEIYVVTYNLMTTPDENRIEQALDMVRNGFVNNIDDGTLLEENRIKVNGFQGRELVVASSKTNQVIRQKIVLANSILFHYGVSIPKKLTLSDDAQKYLDSFEIQAK